MTDGSNVCMNKRDKVALATLIMCVSGIAFGILVAFDNNHTQLGESVTRCEPPLIPIQPFSMMIIDAPEEWLLEAHYWIHEEAFRRGIELPDTE